MVLLVFMRATPTNHSSDNTEKEIRATEMQHKTNGIQGIQPKTAPSIAKQDLIITIKRILPEKLSSAQKANITDVRNLSDG